MRIFAPSKTFYNPIIINININIFFINILANIINSIFAFIKIHEYNKTLIIQG